MVIFVANVAVVAGGVTVVFMERRCHGLLILANTVMAC